MILYVFIKRDNNLDLDKVINFIKKIKKFNYKILNAIIAFNKIQLNVILNATTQI